MHKLFVLFGLLISVYCSSQTKTGELKWKYKTEGRIIGNPCIEGAGIYFGSTDGNLYCNAVSDGKLLWKFAAGKPIASSATAADNKIFFSCDDGFVYALDSRDGKLVWKFAAKGERQYDLWDYYRSSPAFYKGRLYVGSGDGNVYALNSVNGKELWHFKTGGVVHADPVVSNDTVYVGSFDGNFYALSATTGKLIWKFKTIGDRFFPKGEIQKAALVTDNAVYFGSRDYNLYALNRVTGAGLWNMKEYGSWIIATPYQKGNKIFAGTSDSHAFYSLNNFYGELQWKASLPLRSYNTPVGYDTLIFAGCFDGCVYGFGESNGIVQWKFETDGNKKNYSTVYDSTGHFKKDFTMYGSDSITAASEQKIMNLGAVLSTPVIKDDIMYFGSADGSLYAVMIE